MITLKKEGGYKQLDFMEIILGYGDILLATVNHPSGQHGICISDNPNGAGDIGDIYPELCGQPITCNATIGVEIYFRNISDIDNLMTLLHHLKNHIVLEKK